MATRLVRSWLSSIVLGAALIPTGYPQTMSEPQVGQDENDSAALGWAYRNTGRFQDELLGDYAALVDASNQFKCDAFIAVRISGDETLDTQISLWVGPTGVIAAATKAATGSPIVDQLLAAKRKCPACDDKGILGMLQVHCSLIEERRYPLLTNLVAELREMRVSPIPDAYLVLHGVRYDLWIKSVDNIYRYSFDSSQYPPDPDVKLHPLERWCVELVRALNISPTVSAPESR